MFNTTTHSFSPLIKPTIRPRSKLNGYWKDEFNKVVAQIQEEEEIELKIIGYRPQTRLGECAGCKSICEECENLIITEDGEFE